MIHYNGENLIIRSMLESDIEEFVKGFSEQGWHKSQELFRNYYNEQESNERLSLLLK